MNALSMYMFPLLYLVSVLLGHVQGRPDPSDRFVVRHNLLVEFEKIVAASLDALPKLLGDFRDILVSHVDSLGLAVVVVKHKLRVALLLFYFEEHVLVL